MPPPVTTALKPERVKRETAVTWLLVGSEDMVRIVERGLIEFLIGVFGSVVILKTLKRNRGGIDD